jgi:hypothetical protein
VSRSYGNDQFPLEPLFKAITAYELPGFDLSRLFEQPLLQTITAQDIKIISAFYGLVVGFQTRNKPKDSTPILIAVYQEQTIGIHLQTAAISFGELPQPKHVLLNAWIEIHREELLVNWQTGYQRGEFFAIEPLR